MMSSIDNGSQSDKASNSKHVLLLPFLAHGHIKPFVELAKLIRRRSEHLDLGLTITILSTPLNIHLIRKSLEEEEEEVPPPSLATSTTIRVKELPFFSSDHGLPENVENSHALGLPQLIKLFHASTSLEGPLRTYISKEIVAKEGSPPLCIIPDVFLGWAVEVARSFGSLGVVFTTGGAYGTAAYMSIWNDLPHRNQTGAAEDDTFGLPEFPETHRFSRTQLHRFLRAADGADEWSRFFRPQIRKSMSAVGWLCNTVEEVEPLGMSILSNYLKLPVWAVGPTIPKSMLLSDSRPNPDPNLRWVLEWLDSQAEESVVYVSFGSQNTVTTVQMMELAKGLEESGKSFIWVIRPPFGFDIDGEFKADLWLPTGFQERVWDQQRRGLLVHKWGPQKDILAHKSTGVFLSHCGWNSVLESLSQGIPMIGWPLAAEQAYNVKVLEQEMGVAVELTRGLEGKLTKSDVIRVINLFLDKGQDGSKGYDMKRNAVRASHKLKAAMREAGDHKGSTLKAMDVFLHNVTIMPRPQNAV